MMGVHVFSKVYANGNFIVLDLVLHNGMVGADPSPLDDSIDDIYFDALDLHLPDGWEARWAFENPMIGDPVPDGSGTRIPMVKEMRYGQFHNLHQQRSRRPARSASGRYRHPQDPGFGLLRYRPCRHLAAPCRRCRGRRRRHDERLRSGHGGRRDQPQFSPDRASRLRRRQSARPAPGQPLRHRAKIRQRYPVERSRKPIRLG